MDESKGINFGSQMLVGWDILRDYPTIYGLPKTHKNNIR